MEVNQGFVLKIKVFILTCYFLILFKTLAYDVFVSDFSFGARIELTIINTFFLLKFVILINFMFSRINAVRRARSHAFLSPQLEIYSIIFRVQKTL